MHTTKQQQNMQRAATHKNVADAHKRTHIHSQSHTQNMLLAGSCQLTGAKQEHTATRVCVCV